MERQEDHLDIQEEALELPQLEAERRPASPPVEKFERQLAVEHSAAVRKPAPVEERALTRLSLFECGLQ